MDVKIKTALISVSDKSGVVDFAAALAKMSVKIISTGGTAKKLSEAGINVVGIESVTGFVTRRNIPRQWKNMISNRLIWFV